MKPMPQISGGELSVQEEQGLVLRAQKQDGEAFAKLYERYFNKIYRYTSLRIGDRTEAEDITQQVFLKAIKSLSSFKWRNVPFGAWLFRIAHNQVVDHLRKRERRPSVDVEEVELQADDDPQRFTEKSLEMEMVLKAAKELTAAQQQVILLRFAAELSVAEVSLVMNRSQGAVKALQHSAIAALRRKLKTEKDDVR
jgi:RNA polymerase sigma-70 factor (ECF subfamily)